ncbi:MAG: hypothetical protein ACR2PZ_09075 [Pseudomonadales bacterium]
MNTLRLALLLSLTIFGPATAFSAERLVYGKVLTVEPLPNTDESASQSCELVPKPPSSVGLSELLSWDLINRPQAEQRCQAALAQRIQGYRVTYEWNGRRFEDVFPTRPGRHVPLTLQID